jgi:UDP-glucose 4-epimerase
MKILMTGSSSFSGSWFARELAESGCEVHATFTGDKDSYKGIRKKRFQTLNKNVQPIWSTKFGDENFFKLIKENSFDCFLHHGAYVTDYKNDAFDVQRAVNENCFNVNRAARYLANAGCQFCVFTGTFTEPFEAIGDPNHKPFNLYSLSKHLSFEIFRYAFEKMDIKIGKFVMPNPFGPYEEARFTSYLVNEWSQGHCAKVFTPEYVRDNIHISLLSLAYLDYVRSLVGQFRPRANPSGYVGNQKSFTLKFQQELQNRLNWKCDIDFLQQKTFPEPKIKVNFEDAAGRFETWSEQHAWDELVSYYLTVFPKRN